MNKIYVVVITSRASAYVFPFAVSLLYSFPSELLFTVKRFYRKPHPPLTGVKWVYAAERDLVVIFMIINIEGFSTTVYRASV